MLEGLPSEKVCPEPGHQAHCNRRHEQQQEHEARTGVTSPARLARRPRRVPRCPRGQRREGPRREVYFNSMGPKAGTAMSLSSTTLTYGTEPAP